MANAHRIRKSESTPIGIELPLEEGGKPVIVEVSARRIRVDEADELNEKALSLDTEFQKGKMKFVNYILAKIKMNVVISESDEAQLRKLEDIKELTAFSKLCAKIAAGEHDEEKKLE